MNQCHQNLQQKRAKNIYQDIWLLVSKEEKKNLHKEHETIPSDDTYFKEVPKSQEYLTQDQMIFCNKIEYSNYTVISSDHTNIANLYDCFHGILTYIYYYSENKLNTKELEFHFSGAQNRECLTKLIKKNSNLNNQVNILNIFDYSNIKSQFNIDIAHEAFFGVTFKRIEVTPISYSIRSGLMTNTASHLLSFIFEGYDEQNKKWDVLDERVNINDLIASGSFTMFYVHSTNKSYSSFRVKQTEPGNTGFWGFSIAAFDIHGIVSLKEDSKNDEQFFLFDEKSTSFDFENNDIFNPNIDMSEYL